MTAIRWILMLALACPAAAGADPAVATGPADLAEHRRACAGKDGWSDPAPPIRIFGDVYDVGTCGIVVLLLTGPAGHVLIDGATSEAVPSIAANIRRLGIRPTDIRLMLSSHEHLDHAGGLHALQRLTGATMVATAAARPMLQSGVMAPGDPQGGKLPAFPGVKVGRVVRDGEVVRLGPLRLTAHATPGHSPGGTSWSWRTCVAADCRAIVYADSVKALSDGRYRFADHPAYVAAFRRSLDRIGRLPCDLLITPHPAPSRLYERLAAGIATDTRPGCAAYAAEGRTMLDRQLADEAAARRP